MLALAFHAGIIGPGMYNIRDTQSEPFEIKYEVREEILPSQYQIAEEKIIEKTAAEPVPLVQEALMEEVADSAEPAPKEISEELKKSLLRYQDSVKQKIQEEKRYPRGALRLGKEGVVRVFFSLIPSGAIRDIRMVSASGVADLNEEAVNAVKRASPFRPFPGGLDKEELQFEVDIVFSIAER